MKVLIVTNMYPDALRPYNGIFIAEQIDAIKKYHKDVDFDVCYIEGENKGKTEYIKSVFYVNRKICCGGYDIVHIHFGLSGLYLLMPFRKKVPTIVTFHGSDIQPAGGNGPLTVGISHRVARIADTCITLNAYMDAIVRQYNPNTFLVPCAVDTSVFRPSKITEKVPLKCDKKKIVFPCNHGMKVKNYSLFCQVLNILRKKYVIDCDEAELNGLSRKQVVELFNTADLLLMTSHSEGSPQAVKEAMACNLPVVSVPVGDVKELLKGVKDSHVASSHNAEELASLVVEALSHKGHGISGRERIAQLHLDGQAVADRIYSIYEQSIH